MNLLIPHLHVGNVFVSSELRQEFPRVGLSGQRVWIFWTLSIKCLQAPRLRANLGEVPQACPHPHPPAAPSLLLPPALWHARSRNASLGSS